MPATKDPRRSKAFPALLITSFPSSNLINSFASVQLHHLYPATSFSWTCNAFSPCCRGTNAIQYLTSFPGLLVGWTYVSVKAVSSFGSSEVPKFKTCSFPTTIEVSSCSSLTAVWTTEVSSGSAWPLGRHHVHSDEGRRVFWWMSRTCVLEVVGLRGIGSGDGEVTSGDRQIIGR